MKYCRVNIQIDVMRTDMDKTFFFNKAMETMDSYWLEGVDCRYTSVGRQPSLVKDAEAIIFGPSQYIAILLSVDFSVRFSFSFTTQINEN